MTGISLRKFPHPYRAALAVSNDADFMTDESFRFFHRYLNTTKETPLGRGLALPVADSFFLFNSPESKNGFTLFEGLSNQLSTRAGLLLDCARAGLIDTLHTFGDFTSPDHFTRDLARRGLDTLLREGVILRVWVNHGGPSNVQCLGPLTDHFQGDLPGTPCYHADLTTAFGIRFCWLGSALGDYIAYDGRTRAHAVLTWVQGVLRARSLLMLRSALQLRTLVYPLTLRDGAVLLGFNRYAGTMGFTPVLEDLPIQLSARNLNLLKDAGGYSIVYQHFAVRRRLAGFGVDSYKPNIHPYLRLEETAALVRLAEEFHNGNILVTSTERLLRYNAAQRWLRWTSNVSEQGVRIRLVGIEEPSNGKCRLVDLAELEGLTFYTPDPRKTEIWRGTAGADVRVPNLIANPTDHTGRESVSIPISWPGVPDL
jgi:hypothetical protein